MFKRLKPYIFPVVSYVLTLLSALFWVALRVNYSGISKFLGADTNRTFLIMNLPLMVCIFSWMGFALAAVGLVFWKKRRWISIIGFVIGIITTVGGLVIVQFGSWDYITFIMHHYLRSLGVAALLNAFALLVFFPVENKKKWIIGAKCAVVALVILAAVVIGYELRPCSFTYGAVVYAVEDDYQIVFSTSDSAMAWVEIDGTEYYDLYAGSARSKDKVHKITVPQRVLDTAGGYTVCAQQMIYRGPFGGYKGDVISQEYTFRPVDSSDGLNYVSLSDVHSAFDAAATAAREDHLDFIVLLGDLISMVETESDAQCANLLAHDITGGEIPVIYARGNHEIKGEYAEELYKYVGSLNGSFAYTVTLGDDDVFAAVLDLGEDHADDWWEYYGTAKFDIYRQEQTEMLQAALEDGSYKNYSYRMAICHIPFVYIDKHGYYESFRTQWTQLLNEMEMDISLSGHKHKVLQFLPDTLTPGEPLVFSEAYYGREGKKEGGTVTDFDFPAFLVGQRSLSQTGGLQEWGFSDYLCLHTEVNLTEGRQVSRYINSLGQTVPVVYPFVCEGTRDEIAAKEIVTELK